ncbi:unnamed protein product, partial [marine sediment metagenome]
MYLQNTGGVITIQASLYSDPLSKIVASTFTPVLNTEYEIIHTWDGVNVNLYINSSLEETDTSASPAFDLFLNNRDSYMGASYTKGPGLIGSMSLMEIYNKDLTQEEVTNLYNDARYVMPKLERSSGNFITVDPVINQYGAIEDAANDFGLNSVDDAFTVTGWFRTTNTELVYKALVGKMTGTGINGRWALCSRNGSMGILASGASTTFKAIPGISDGEWHFVSLRLNGDGTGDLDVDDTLLDASGFGDIDPIESP